jgi:hypothetical protein
MPVCLRFSIFRVLFASLAPPLLAGCSASFASSKVAPNRVPIGNMQGRVHGSQAPVTGAQIYLFAAAIGGYGTSATSLIANAFANGTCRSADVGSDVTLPLDLAKNRLRPSEAG